MPELLIDFITSLDGYGAAEGWPGWWGLQGPEYLTWLGEAPEATALVSTVEDVDRLNVADPERVSYITQTTLSLDETRDIRFLRFGLAPSVVSRRRAPAGGPGSRLARPMGA